VSVKVSPAQVEAVRARLDELKRGNESITFVDVVADQSVAPDRCVVESEFGSVDAGIEAQLAVLDRAIRAQLARGGEG
jgi:type III secretion protein L